MNAEDICMTGSVEVEVSVSLVQHLKVDKPRVRSHSSHHVKASYTIVTPWADAAFENGPVASCSASPIMHVW